MVLINKGKEPDSLTEYKTQPEAQYDGPHFTAVKEDIRAALLAEQGYICAYCQQRINKDNMKVEHWACQSHHADKQLSYKNLLGCCEGLEGENKKHQTCDTRKANMSLKYSPAQQQHQINSRVYYLSNGIIKSKEADFDRQLNDVLNLNSTFQNNRLVKNREAAIKTIKSQLNRSQGTRTKADIKRLMTKVHARNTDNMFKPFYGVMLHYLEKKL